MRALYEMKNSKYCQDEINACNGNMRTLWQTFKGALADQGGKDVSVLTPEDFVTFFKEKVESVRSSTSATPPYDVPYRTVPPLEEWTPVSIDEVEKLIGSSLYKTCQLDPAPTWLVKEACTLLSPFITLLFNKSLVSSVFPSEFKKAVVRVLL